MNCMTKVETYNHEPKEPTQSVSVPVSEIWPFSQVVPYLCIGQNQKNHLNLVLYLGINMLMVMQPKLSSMLTMP